MTPTVLAIVPLRLASTRIPRKILSDIGGKCLAVRTVGRALAAFKDDASVRVVAAVDNIETQRVLRKAYKDLEILLTAPELPSGTDRVFAAANEWLKANPKARTTLKGILNIQGDMPFAGLEGLRDAARFYATATPADLERYGMLTLSQPWPREIPLDDAGSVKVITDRDGAAIYFSRHAIPYSRVKLSKTEMRDLTQEICCDLHIGVYGYTLDALARVSAHVPVTMEKCESLEQLRALWLGVKIFVIKTQPSRTEDFRGIDLPRDLTWARRFARTKPSSAKGKSSR
ncbi:MAG: hypothetical protein JST16_08325 [Bdellovibrionales bacterium]|nr:hypothetical protein [Bdellovibrionales bacterium]